MRSVRFPSNSMDEQERVPPGRLAVLSDIHGNRHALDAVLTDVDRRGGVDGYVVLGDLAAIGADPVGVLARLAALPNAIFVQGNTDRYLVTGERPYPSLEQARADPALVARLVEVAQSFAWTQGCVTAAGWFEWLAALPLERHLTLPDGTRLLLTHIAPGLIEGPGISPGTSDEQLAGLMADRDADLVLVGHTHWPLDRRVNGVRVVNVGSLSNGWAPDPRASYGILRASADGYEVELCRVDYDRAAAAEAVRRAHHPSGAFVIGWLTNPRTPWWETPRGRDWAGDPQPIEAPLHDGT